MSDIRRVILLTKCAGDWIVSKNVCMGRRPIWARKRHLWLLQAIYRSAENPAVQLFSSGRVVSAPATHAMRARSQHAQYQSCWCAPPHFYLARSAHPATLCERALRR